MENEENTSPLNFAHTGSVSPSESDSGENPDKKIQKNDIKRNKRGH